jgi:maltose O-acetyltransferase
MTVSTKILQKAGYYFIRIRSEWNFLTFFWLGRAMRKHLDVGKHVLFNVPVRGDGAGTLMIGSHNSFGYRPAFRLGTGEILLQARHPNGIITIGEANVFNNNVSIVSNEQITIGDKCQIGDLVTIYDCDFHEINPATRNRSCGKTKPVCIGNNVWLGSRVMVLKGVTIGDNSVIAAASVVTKSIPANCIAAGNPAKVIRFI